MTFRQPLAQVTRTQLVINKSMFMTSITKSETTSDAKAFLARIKMEFPNASHNVYAFAIGHGQSVVEGKSEAHVHK